MTLSFHATRLAPSPTGALHLGHARTFLITWWLARQAGGGGAKIYMRMEDLDAARAKPESVQQAYDDLHWLGMDWDPFVEPRATNHESRPTSHEPPAEVVQSTRTALYDQALDTLRLRDLIYPCTCTRADIAAVTAASASAPHESDAQLRYPGTCAPKPRTTSHESRATPSCWRLRTRPGPIPFTDLIAGPQSFDVAADSGDFPLTRFDGTPAYQLACVVDDHVMAIDLVIRGADLLPSTARQLLLYEALGWPAPRFAHIPLVIGPDGKRLAKRHGESRIAQFRAVGVSAERIVGWAAWRSGQLDQPRLITASDMIATFDLAQLPRQPLILGPEDFAWLRP